MASTTLKPTTSRSTPRLGKTARMHLGNGLAWLILGAGGVIMLLPFLWMVSASIKGLDEIYAFPPRFIPERILWSNYVEAWRMLPFGRFFLNSTIVSVSVVLGQLFTCSLAGYSFARLRYPGRDKLFLLYLSTMMIPFAVVMIPLYVQMRWFNWIDTLWPLIIPAIFTPWGTFLMRQFMSTLPRELEDAGRIDGCSFFRLYASIILPLTKPALATLGIFTFLSTWNNFLWPLIIISSVSNKTLPLGLVMFRTRLPMETPWQLVMAASTFSIVPILVVFIMGQKYYVQGIVTSGIKGGA
ncbi:MAG TPA: carbohydrate ABC transporter permease [Caldilineaceae bacterium]|nr:carbohydrate ABC transporter permease [Caldilineaceae bacterium]